MIEKGIQRIGRPLADINGAIENTGKLEIYALEKGLPTMATVAGGAPMIGFLGTVMGMIRAFYDMSMAGNNIDVSLLSNGIYTALVTTVAGLIVGIVAYFCYNILVARVEKVVNKLEAHSTEFLDLLNDGPVAHSHLSLERIGIIRHIHQGLIHEMFFILYIIGQKSIAVEHVPGGV